MYRPARQPLGQRARAPLGRQQEHRPRRRRVLGIPAFKPGPVPWTGAMRALLGSDSDPKVARSLRVTVKAVRRERWRLGIPPFRPAPLKLLASGVLRGLTLFPGAPDTIRRFSGRLRYERYYKLLRRY